MTTVALPPVTRTTLSIVGEEASLGLHFAEITSSRTLLATRFYTTPASDNSTAR
jgi:hypothetical protein